METISRMLERVNRKLRNPKQRNSQALNTANFLLVTIPMLLCSDENRRIKAENQIYKFIEDY